MFGTLVLVARFVASATSIDSQLYGHLDENEYATNCQEIQKRGNTTSGIYPIEPDFHPEPFLHGLVRHGQLRWRMGSHNQQSRWFPECFFQYHIHYKTLSIASEEQYCRLQILGGHSGDLEDSLTYHGGSRFSTIDRDNDKHTGGSCGKDYDSGRWFRICHTAHLTGGYYSAVRDNSREITWNGYRKINPNFQYYTLKEARKMIRPQSDHGLKHN